jgi:hypothetical protein
MQEVSGSIPLSSTKPFPTKMKKQTPRGTTPKRFARPPLTALAMRGTLSVLLIVIF